MAADNPSYFTVSGSSASPSSSGGGGGLLLTSKNAPKNNHNNNKKFANWLPKLKRPFRTTNKTPAVDENRNAAPQLQVVGVGGDGEEPKDTAPRLVQELDEVVYYNFSAAAMALVGGGVGSGGGGEDVLPGETSATLRKEHAAGANSITGSSRTLNHQRHRHSLGTWFRSSLAAVRKNAPSVAASAASGLDAAASSSSSSAAAAAAAVEHEPLGRTVSSSRVSCISSRFVCFDFSRDFMYFNDFPMKLLERCAFCDVCWMVQIV